MAAKLTILLSGMIAAVPHQGGATWAVLQYLLGFKRLGHEVYFVEPVEEGALRPAGTSLTHTANAAYFRQVVSDFGLKQNSALLLASTRQTVGLPYDRLRQVAHRAHILVNISGLLADESLTGRIPLRVYLDLDPAFTQLWHAVQGIDMRFAGHSHFVTVGQAIGQTDCAVPTCGLPWITTPQPIVLEHWPVAGHITYDALTTGPTGAAMDPSSTKACSTARRPTPCVNSSPCPPSPPRGTCWRSPSTPVKKRI